MIHPLVVYLIENSSWQGFETDLLLLLLQCQLWTRHLRGKKGKIIYHLRLTERAALSKY